MIDSKEFADSLQYVIWLFLGIAFVLGGATFLFAFWVLRHIMVGWT